MIRTPINDFGDHYTNQLYYVLFNFFKYLYYIKKNNI